MAAQQQKRRDARIEAALSEIVRRLVAEYQPEKIILFGSYAYGEPHEDSDLDVLVVKETSDRLIDRIFAVHELVTDAYRNVAFEPLVLTPAEIDQRLRIGDQFIAEILNRGEILYAA
jgi:predicted nucleotidyltransferase